MSGFELALHFPERTKQAWFRSRFKHVLREVDERNQDGDTSEKEGLLGLSKSRGVLKKDDMDQRASEAGDYSKYKKVRTGQLVSNKMQAWNGMFGISPFDGFTSPDYAIYEFRGSADKSFIEYAIRSPMFAAEFHCRSRGMGTGFLRLNPGEFLATEFFHPDLLTQKRIAAFLDRETARIDELIAKKERLVEVLGQQEKNQLAHMFSKLESPQWRVRHLGKIKNGAGFPVDHQGDPNNAIPFFKVKHLKEHGLDASITHSDDTISHETAKLLRATVFPKGTIILAKIGAALLLARFSKIGVDACLDNNLAAFIPRTQIIEPDFALLGLSLIDMATMVQPGAVPSMDTEAFYNFRLPLPALQEQRRVISEYRDFRMRLQITSEKVSISLNRLKEYRAALITAAVTGQIDVDTYGKTGATSATLDKIEEEMQA